MSVTEGIEPSASLLRAFCPVAELTAIAKPHAFYFFYFLKLI